MHKTSVFAQPCVSFVAAIDYVQFLLSHRSKQEANLEKLRKEVMALKIMKA